MHARYRCLAPTLIIILALSACSDGVTDTNNDGPWLGNWVQVNFLSLDDNGVWDDDDPTGIGFVATVTESEWVLTDEYGTGCAVTFSYSVDSTNKFSREAVSTSSNCPSFPLELLGDSGRLEFSNGNAVMIEWFDVQPGDDIVAFKFVRR